jgi:translation initiation factor IF-2
MGHVDHGKTSLLDALRSSAVAQSEAGGITQHIGAFSVKVPSGRKITFIDTPGHAAFNKMRQRGAKITDIVILVVAADDGVMPQTIEAIQHAQSANVPLIVAINKCDKENLKIEHLMGQLSKHNVLVEDYGGDVPAVKISALKKQGLLELEEAILAQAEIMDIRGDASGLTEGYILESRLDRGKG